jgi:modification target Cys-rich repeat protein
MKTNRFDLSDEQSLRIRDLRKTLADALPAPITEEAQFPISQFSGCGGVCMSSCAGTCVSFCGNHCSAGCTDTCSGSCSDGCINGCKGGCLGWH